MSSKNSIKHDDKSTITNLDLARDLVRHLETGNQAEADRVIKELSDIRQSDLYREIGKLTRDLHETINSFIDDTRVHNVMHAEIPDARERLTYVIKLTEETTHNTLTAVEQTTPIINEIESRSKALKDRWQKISPQKNGADISHTLTIEFDDYLQHVIDESSVIRRNLSDILIAQSSQDITGQLIQRVINLVHDLEHKLVGIVHTSSQLPDDKTPGKSTEQVAIDNNKGHGPSIPGVTKGDVMNSQDDVDDLLSSLGF